MDSMSRSEKIHYIRRLPLFSELKREEIEQIEPLFLLKSYRAGEYIYRQAERSYALFLFVTGRGRLLRVDADGIERRGDDVEQGEYVGERSLFLHEERSHSLVVVKDTVALILPKRDLDNFLRDHPDIKARLNVRLDIRNQAQDQDFPWLEDGELVLRYTRRHIWAFWRRAALSIPLLLLTAPLPLIALLLPLPDTVSNLLFVLALLPMLLFPLATIAYNYYDWRNDWFVITNQRVVHEERVLLTFNETRQQAPLSSIQAVKTSQQGYFAEQFGFGDLIISTIGAAGTLTFDTIPHPEALSTVINDELRRTSAHRAAESREKIRSEIDRFIGTEALNRSRAGELPQVGGSQSRSRTPRSIQTRLEERWRKFVNYFDIRVRVDEGFRITYRKHWLVLWNVILPPTLAMIGLVILLIINLVFHGSWPWSYFHPLLRILFFLVLFPLVGAWWWFMYEDWHNDQYIIEEETLKRIHRRPLWLHDEQSTVLLRNVQGVSVLVRGIWQKLLNYGSVIVQTAADDGGQATGEIAFEYIYQPHALQEDILSRQRRGIQKTEQQEVDQVAQQIARWLAVYHQATHPDDFGQAPIDADKGAARADDEETRYSSPV